MSDCPKCQAPVPDPSGSHAYNSLPFKQTTTCPGCGVGLYRMAGETEWRIQKG